MSQLTEEVRRAILAVHTILGVPALARISHENARQLLAIIDRLTQSSEALTDAALERLILFYHANPDAWAKIVDKIEEVAQQTLAAWAEQEIATREFAEANRTADVEVAKIEACLIADRANNSRSWDPWALRCEILLRKLRAQPAGVMVDTTALATWFADEFECDTEGYADALLNSGLLHGMPARAQLEACFFTEGLKLRTIPATVDAILALLRGK